MLSFRSRRTCPFGLPDEAEDVENVILVAVGHVFRTATAPMLDSPLPAELVDLLTQIDRQERNARVAARPCSNGDALIHAIPPKAVACTSSRSIDQPTPAAAVT